jgi:adenosylhomocysteinase
MDMSFADQALSSEHVLKNGKRLKNEVYRGHESADNEIARTKLSAMGVFIDKPTPEQKQYLASWDMGA